MSLEPAMLELLRGADVCAGLTEAELQSLAGVGREEVFERGRAIVRAGDPVSKFYRVAAGVVEVGRPGPHNGRRRLERGAGFGELALFEEIPSPVEIVASVTPETRLGAWHLLDVQRLLAANPVLAAKLARNVLKKVGAQLQAMHVAIRALSEDLG